MGVARVWAEAGDFPVMGKAPLEDNSRGVHLLGRQCLKGSHARDAALDADLTKEMKARVLEILGLGDTVLFEQFVPGREIRFGVVELRNAHGLDAYRHTYAGDKKEAPITSAHASKAQVHGIPIMLEYMMMDASMPIRTAADKLNTDARGQMAQKKCVRRLVSCDPRVYASPDPTTGKIAPRMDANGVDQAVYPDSAKLQGEIETIVRAAHRALGCRGYSLFDIRVDATSGRPFIIECCAFWSFSTISVLSLMLESSGIDYKRVILDLWREQALTPAAAERRTCKQIKMPKPAALATSL